MRGDVIKTILSAKNVTNAIVLTHNIDFVFIQTVVLAAFQRCGHPTLTIFADATCAAESFVYQHPLLTGLGVRYRVVPVAMEPGFRFHPKAVLLSGEKSATLLVGSGNLTFGGWRENAELWLQFDSEQDGVTPFHAFKDYLNEILERVPLRDAVVAEVEDAFDPKSKPWASSVPSGDARLVGRAGSGLSLLDRMLGAVGSDPVDELLVCTPFFDDEGVGLRELVFRVGAKRTTLLCQPERSTLTRRSWEPSAGQAVLQRVDFTRKSASGEERSAFIHAKLFAFRRAHEVIVLAGSANCSRAALTISGRAGNAELQATRVITPSEFEEEFQDELKVTLEPIALSDEPVRELDDGIPVGLALRILAARFETRNLLVAFSPPDAKVVDCQVDGASVRFSAVEKGVLSATSGLDPRVVVLRARVDNKLIESAPAWVDHEQHLRATALSRSLADTIRMRIQPGEWNSGGWADVLDVFCKSLTYMPAYRASGAAIGSTTKNDDSGEVQFTAADVFSPSYRPPALSSILIPGVFGGTGYIQSLQQLLLRWFGVETEESEGEDETISGTNEEEDDETVDHPEQLKLETQLKPPLTEEVSKRNRNRIEAVLSQIENAMTSTEFLTKRSPGCLATDIKLAAVLLRIGLQKGWIERKRFFDLTQKIWFSLFFSSEVEKNVGWLEYRASTAEDRETFVNDLRSPELSAALIGWKLCAPTDDVTPEAARFALVTVLAVARLPWLWQGGESMKIEKEVELLLAHTADPGVNQDVLRRQAETEWDLLLRRGQALRLLETAVSRIEPKEIKDRIRSAELCPGDLLWQGDAGFCVVRQRALRTTEVKVKVLKLQDSEGEKLFDASFAIPMRELLNEDIVPRSETFGDEPRLVLRELIDDLSKGFAR